MKIDALIKMANQIAAFFDGEGGHDPEEAAKLAALHLRRYWEPRMREQIIQHLNTQNGEGLDELARSSVALLAAGKVG